MVWNKNNVFWGVMMLVLNCFCANVTGCGASSEEEKLAEEIVANDGPLSIMVNDKLYYCYGEIANAPAEDEICGTIQSCTEKELVEVPTENEQSNFEFCVGEEWAISHGRVLIYYEGEWHKCVLSTVPDTPIYPES